MLHNTMRSFIRKCTTTRKVTGNAVKGTVTGTPSPPPPPQTPLASITANQATISVRPYLLYKLKEGPASIVTVNRDEALDYFKKMVTIRELELTAAKLYRSRLIRGFCHLYDGQEAIAVGLDAAMRPQDSLITSYREHAYALLMGGTIHSVLSELTGVDKGCAKGKGGSMHMYGKNFYGGNAIVAAQVPVGVGLAFASKYKGDGGVCFALFGDGASNQGQVYESFNMAKLWGIPCVFLCENNLYGMGTSADRSSMNTKYYTRGDQIPGIWVDGMDVLAVREAARFSIEFCNKHKSPIVWEAATYRYSGHSLSDPGTSYRTRDEVKEVRKTRDPIASIRKLFTDNKLGTENELIAIAKDIKKSISKAAAEAVAGKEIPVEELTYDIYAENVEPYIRNIFVEKPLYHKNTIKPK